MKGKLKDITQKAKIVKAIRLFVTFVRKVFGFLTAKYLSTAKLIRLRSDAVHEIKVVIWLITNSPGIPCFLRPSLMRDDTATG